MASLAALIRATATIRKQFSRLLVGPVRPKSINSRVGPRIWGRVPLMPTSTSVFLVLGSDETSAYLSDTIRFLEAECICAAEAEAALGLYDLIARSGKLVDVAFLHACVPGLEHLIRQIRKKDILHYSRIVVFGADDSVNLHRMLEAGANSCIGADRELLCVAAYHWIRSVEVKPPDLSFAA